MSDVPVYHGFGFFGETLDPPESIGVDETELREQYPEVMARLDELSDGS